MSAFHNLDARKIAALKLLLPSKLAHEVDEAWLDENKPPIDSRIQEFVDLVQDWPVPEKSNRLMICGSTCTANELQDLLLRYDLPGYVLTRKGYLVVDQAAIETRYLDQYLLLARAKSVEVMELGA